MVGPKGPLSPQGGAPVRGISYASNETGQVRSGGQRVLAHSLPGGAGSCGRRRRWLAREALALETPTTRPQAAAALGRRVRALF